MTENAMRKLSLDEQETTFTIEATDRDTIHVYSGDGVWQKRLEKAGALPYRDCEDGGKFYKLDSRQIILRSIDQVNRASERGKREYERRLKEGIGLPLLPTAGE